MACLVSIGCSGTDVGGVLDLPFASHIRSHIFVATFATLLNMGVVVFNSTSMVKALSLHWHAFVRCFLISFFPIMIAFCTYVHENTSDMLVHLFFSIPSLTVWSV